LTEKIQNCPSCSEKITDGVFKSNLLLATSKTMAINDHHGLSLTYSCNACGKELFEKAASHLRYEQYQLRTKLTGEIAALPILSLHTPLGWDYRAIGIVTAQSTTGTGLFSDVASAWTDAFGMQSGTYNGKIRAGEDLCKRSLRLAALECGGNAVVAADVDYAEVGGTAAMLMVCMTGTAVQLCNPNILGDGYAERLAQVANMHARLAKLDQFELGEA
jgi:uncharacterized protein YbjQ (UPF0145 family)